MTNKELADLMYPHVTKTIEDYEKIFPKRNLKDGAMVSRYAPSPTGFVHMGNMLSCFIENIVPKRTGGKFYLRIEDTDQKREVAGGIDNIISAMKTIGLSYDEGVISEEEELGSYGPYIQSKRRDIYHAFAKYMIENDLAYPCFCEAGEIEEIRNIQKENKERIGYYGEYAKCRNLTNDERAEKIKAGMPYTIRIKSRGDFNKRVKFHDEVKGDIEFPENDQDMILIKSDGMPLYHFAHLVDDHLMRTTHVLRGEDWLPSVPLHLELFDMFGFERPKYAHLGLIMIVDSNGTKRKISKRKDKDFAVKHYHEIGMPSYAMQEYLMTIANSNFEAWREENKDKPIEEFPFDFAKIGSSPLFDYSKLVNISKNYISTLSAKEVYDNLYTWCDEFDKDFLELITKYKDYTIDVLNIEREQEKPRKDFSCYSEIKSYIWYMYDELFSDVTYEWQNINDIKEINTILNTYIDKYYDINDDKDTWFSKIKLLCDELGYASNIKDYKKNPDAYKGSVVDVSMVIRVAVTTKKATPDLYDILKLLGTDRIKTRIDKIK
ncbi:MAG: glutamate--tRNA ligase [Bacilli bacterium]|nr:glutamate--tRNA ligase [Bacilli bacterium]